MNQLYSNARFRFFSILLTLTLIGFLRLASAAIPIVTSGSSASATVGIAFGYQIAATDSPTLYGASGLPAGLNVDANSGLISGTPSMTGTYSAGITATNNDGTGSGALTIVVQPGATTLNWTGNVSNDWFDAGNWDAQFVPRSIDAVVIGSGTVLASDSATFSALTLNGGTLTGNLTVSGTMTWNGGTVDGLVTVPGAGLVTLAYVGGDPKLTGTLNNSGTITTGSNVYSTPTLRIGAQGVLNNLATGLLAAPTTYGLSIMGTAGATFSNSGTVLCSMGYGQLALSNVGFTNTGIVNIQTGTFSSDIGFTNSGIMATGSDNFGHFASIDLTGTVSGTLTASNNTLNRGSLRGDFSVSGTVNWAGGTLSASTTVLQGGAIIVTSNASTPNLTGTLNNNGLISTGSNVYSTPTLSIAAQGQLNNLAPGLFTVPSSYGLFIVGSSGATFSNAGTLRCSTAFSQVSLFNVAFTNTGLVDIQTGTFSSDIGFSNSGTMTTGSDSFGHFGSIDLTGTISGNLTASNNTLNRGSLGGTFNVSGTLNWSGGTLGTTTSVLQGGAIVVGSNASTPNLTGTLNNYGLISTGTNTFSTTNLSIAAQGQLINFNSGLFTVPSQYGLNIVGSSGAIFYNWGTLRCSSAFSQISLSHVTFMNIGLLDIQTGTFSSDIGFSNGGTMTTGSDNFGHFGAIDLTGTISGNLTASNNTLNRGILAGNFNVSGTLNWSGGTLGATTAVLQGGAVIVTSNASTPNLTGTLVNYGLISTGTSASSTTSLSIAAQGWLRNLAQGQVTVPSQYGLNIVGSTGAVFSNAGTLRCSTAYSQVALSNVAFTNTGLVDIQTGTFSSDIGFVNSSIMTTGSDSFGHVGSIDLTGTISGNLSASNNTLNRGTLWGAFNVTGTVNWSGGTLASYTTILPGGALMVASSASTPNLSGTLHNNGLISTGSNVFTSTNFSIAAQGRIDNYAPGLFTVPGYGLNLIGSPGASFSNVGTVRCSTSYAQFAMTNVMFTNTGLVDVRSGTFSSDIGFNSTGTMITGSSSGYLGSIDLSGTITGNLPASNNTLRYGSVYGNFLLTGTLNWSGGNLGGNSTVAPGGAVVITTNGSDPSLNGTLANNGLVTTKPYTNWTPNLRIGAQGQFYNLGLGTFTFSTSYGLNVIGTPGALFNNGGTIQSLMTYATMNFSGVSFSNAGAINIQSGSVLLDSFAQTSGTLKLTFGGSLQCSQPMQISGGTVLGTGTLAASVNNTGGSIKPGNSIGALYINGDYTQSGSGMLEFELSGTTPRTGYDTLTITGTANLGGSLKASFNGLFPAAGESFALLSYGSLGTNSLSYNLPTLAGLTFEKTFSPTLFTLSISPTALSSWKKQKFGANAGNPAISGDGVVNNAAGLTNLMAYALGVDPYGATSSDVPATAVQNLSGSNYLTYTFNRDSTASDLTYTVEVTSNLNDPNSWTSIATSINGAATTGPGLVSETGAGSILAVLVRDTQPVDSSAHRYMRLRVWY